MNEFRAYSTDIIVKRRVPQDILLGCRMLPLQGV